MRTLRLLVALGLVFTVAVQLLDADEPASAAVPGTPTNVSITAGVHSVTVDWDAPAGGADRYVVRLFPTARQITTTTAGPVTFDRLVSDADYSVTVTAIDDTDGFGTPVASATVTVLDDPLEPPRIAEVGESSAGAHNCALFDDGTIRCWGDGALGRLGYGNIESLGDDESIADLPAVDLGARAVQISLAGHYTCALTTTGTVRCWGSGSNGRLGYGHSDNIGDDETPASAGDIDLGATAVQVAAGRHHVCAITASSTVRCWGGGALGRLGYGNSDHIGDDETPASAGDVDLGATPAQLSLGSLHTCALTTTGNVRCWGDGSSGRLGYGNTDHIGDDETPASAGDVDLGALVVDLGTGRQHNCAVTTTGTVRCWGNGPNGRLGYANTDNIGDDETPAAAGDIDLGATATHVVADWDHTCALITTGNVRCWGSGALGQLGHGNTDTIGDDETPASAGDIDLDDTVAHLATGAYHNCAVLTDQTMQCWGRAASGRLGYGNTDDIGDDELPSSTTPIHFTTAPGAPTATTDATTSSLTITLTAPTDDGGTPITSYDLTAEPGGHTANLTGPGTVTLTGLTPATTHTITITATNAYGTSATNTFTADSATEPAPEPEPAPDPEPTPEPEPEPVRSGYWMIDTAGTIFAFGDASTFDPIEVAPSTRVLDLAATPTGNGLWVLDTSGTVHVTGDATHHGDLEPDTTGTPVALTPTASGDGYWIVTTTGDVSTHGDAVDHGDLTDRTLNAPIVATSATTTGAGYWLAAADGGVFAFGDAAFHSSLGGQPLNQPVNDIATDPDGRGYWLTADDGGVFAFDADFTGNTVEMALNAPVIGIVSYGDAYATAAADGGAFVFAPDLPFHGSLGAEQLARPIVAAAALPAG